MVPTPAPTPNQVGDTGPAPGPQSRWIGPAQCQGDDVTYTAPPVSLEDTWIIEPMGKLHGGHVTPTDHTYIRHTQMTEFEKHRDTIATERIVSMRLSIGRIKCTEVPRPPVVVENEFLVQFPTPC